MGFKIILRLIGIDKLRGAVKKILADMSAKNSTKIPWLNFSDTWQYTYKMWRKKIRKNSDTMTEMDQLFTLNFFN